MRLGLLAGYCRRGMQPYPMGPAEPGKLGLGDSEQLGRRWPGGSDELAESPGGGRECRLSEEG